MSQQSAAEYLAHGQMPFFRLPSAPLAAGLPEGTRAALLGVPYDGGATYRPGARLAPFEVRRVSALVQGHHPGHGVDPFERLAAVDAGNVVFPPFDAPSVRHAIEASTAAVLAAGAVPLLVGGDHSITLPALRAVAARHGPVAVLHLDAHLDTSDAEVWGDAWHHGTPFRRALEERLVAHGQLHQVGIRGPRASERDVAFGAAHGAQVHGADELGERGVRDVMRDVLSAVGDLPLYLSFDVDAVDPAFAPGTGTPVPGGLTSREALQVVRALAGASLAGMDVVEVCPPFDHADATSLLAAHLLFEGLAVAALAPGRAG
ncbi:MAG TPA: agmatinase [Anaeromyxobacter sp.]